MSDDVPAAEPAEPTEKPSGLRRALLWGLIPLAIAGLAAARWIWTDEAEGGRPEEGRRPVPVEVAPIEVGTIEGVRELTGTLEPSARVVIAAEIEGTVERVHVDLADEVEPGQLLVEIDDREYRQAELAARAELAVARARAEAAESAQEMAARALERAEALSQRGIASDRALDDARGAAAAARAERAVTAATVSRAQATYSAARLQVQRTRIAGRWDSEDGARRVAAREVDEGARVSVGDPLVTLVDTDPLVVAVMVSAVDHARLAPGQTVQLRSDGAGSAEGVVARVAPAFDPESRQARVEIEVDNGNGALSPGRFVRASISLERVEAGAIVPESAVVRREGQDVVFLLDEGASEARMVSVRTGLRAGGRVEVMGEGLEGGVITLGQQRLTDGAPVRRVGAPADGEAP